MTEKLNTNGEITTADVNEKKHKGNIQNLKHFVKGDERTKECAVLGGIKRVEQIKKRKSLNELANTLLDGRVSRERATEILGELADYFTDEELTNGALMLGRLWRETMENGTIKGAEFLRDTSGQKPTEKIETTLNTINDNDRALLRNIAERMNGQNAGIPRG